MADLEILEIDLSKLLISGFVQDGISASHPYGVMVVPPFAEAVGVYHTNSKYVWIPAQKALGDFNNDFAEDFIEPGIIIPPRAIADHLTS